MTSFMGADDTTMIDEIFQSGAAVKTFSEVFSQLSSALVEAVNN